MASFEDLVREVSERSVRPVQESATPFGGDSGMTAEMTDLDLANLRKSAASALIMLHDIIKEQKRVIESQDRRIKDLEKKAISWG